MSCRLSQACFGALDDALGQVYLAWVRQQGAERLDDRSLAVEDQREDRQRSTDDLDWPNPPLSASHVH